MKINRLERNRTFVVFMAFSVWVLAIVFTLVRHQVFNYNRYVSKVRAQTKRILSLHPRRGTIYDRNGDILAISIQAKSAFLSAKDPKGCLKSFEDMRKVVPVSRPAAVEIRRRIRRGDRFIWYRRKLTDNEYKRLLEVRQRLADPSQLNFLDEYRRVYPQNGVAAHLLGGVGIDEQGLFGVEFGLDQMIRGRGGKVRVQRDARRKVFAVEPIEAPRAGRDITLTIDAPLQYMVEQELKRWARKFQARAGAVVVMNVRDGSLLAMASYPGFKPDQAWTVPYERVRNKAFSFLYEPGSTFKVVLAAAALENRVVQPSQVFDCGNGHFTLRNRRIEDVHPFSRLTFRDIIIRSSNVGAAKVGLILGAERYYGVIREFGFGRSVDLKLPGGESGLLKPARRWSEVSPAFMAFGYELMVTPLQMARAFNTIASGGIRVEPRLIENVDGVTLDRGKARRIISRRTAFQLTAIMREVVERGTGQRSRIPGLGIAGKTGTAKKVRNGKYSNVYVSSFGGFFPLPEPRFTMFVVVDEPRTKYYGGEVAAPLFQAICARMRVTKRMLPARVVQGVS